MADANITVDGKKITAPAGSLLIDACKNAGIEIPSFCYYPNLSLQGACRMCVVRVDAPKMPKLQTACTTTISDGMVVTTDSEEVKQSRKAVVEILLGNHPLDCPVCDAGGQCELQDMTFTYGASESRYVEPKNHKQEQQWSPVVFFDSPRCILCYRCVRVCNEAMDVAALGVENRGVSSLIVPNGGDHLDCEECGMCIDICPVGALTSGSYRYKTRPWEMNHVSTICTHCGDGCKTTLGVRSSEAGMEILRGDNRDKSGINDDFLCIKGRYAFDFANREDRLRQPLVRKNGVLTAVTWEEAVTAVGDKFAEVKQSGGVFGVIGSPRSTNEEAYLLQKFARSTLGTNNIDHQRTADFPAFVSALAGKPEMAGSMRDAYMVPAILLLGGDATDEHPLLAYQVRNNVRLHSAKLYVVNSQEIKLKRQAAEFAQIPAGTESGVAAFLAGDDSAVAAIATAITSADAWRALRETLRSAQNLLIAFSSDLQGDGIANIAKFAGSVSGAKVICLADYANSRGVADMGLYPDLLPGYASAAKAGLDLAGMSAAAQQGKLGALLVVGANPVYDLGFAADSLNNTFVVVQDMFLTETAAIADVVLPSASAYETSGTFTNTSGDLQLVKKAGDLHGTKPDFEIIVRIASAMGVDVSTLVPLGAGTTADMGQSRGAQSGEADRSAVYLQKQGLEARVSPFDAAALFDEIQRLVPGYDVSRMNLMAGNDVRTTTAGKAAALPASRGESLRPAHDTLFSSGSLGRYSRVLNSVAENRDSKLVEVAAD